MDNAHRFASRAALQGFLIETHSYKPLIKHVVTQANHSR
jgi:hypothetical protein